MYHNLKHTKVIPSKTYLDQETQEEKVIPELTFSRATVAGGDTMRTLRSEAWNTIIDRFTEILGEGMVDKPFSEWPKLVKAQYDSSYAREYVLIPVILCACVTPLNEEDVANWPLNILNEYYLEAVELNPSWDMREDKVKAATEAGVEQVEAVDESTGKKLDKEAAKKKA